MANANKSYRLYVRTGAATPKVGSRYTFQGSALLEDLAFVTGEGSNLNASTKTTDFVRIDIGAHVISENPNGTDFSEITSRTARYLLEEELAGLLRLSRVGEDAWRYLQLVKDATDLASARIARMRLEDCIYDPKVGARKCRVLQEWLDEVIEAHYDEFDQDELDAIIEGMMGE